MGRISVALSDELEKKLRFKTIERFGGRKGDLSRAVTEAVKTWIEKENQMCEYLFYNNARKLHFKSEDRFISEKVILIDGAGWGDLILGVVIGALNPPDPRYMERRIPVSSFQPPNFQDKQYLDDTMKIADEIVEVMQPDMETRFKVCSGYVLSSIRKHLREQGFNVEEVELTGELQEKVERSYIRWCKEVGVPAERLEDKRRFWTFLEWVAERPWLREKLVKTGWKSWKTKWRQKAFKDEFLKD